MSPLRLGWQSGGDRASRECAALCDSPISVLVAASCKDVRARCVSAVRDAFPGANFHRVGTILEVGGASRGVYPELLLIELESAKAAGLDLVRRLRAVNPNCCVIAVGMSAEGPLLLSALQAGVRGFLNVDEPPDMLERQVKAAARGELALSPAITDKVLGYFAQWPSETTCDALSARECEVLRLMAAGMSAGVIAGRLGVRITTVQTHVRRIYNKLGVSTRAQATRAAIGMGLLTQGKTDDG